MRVLPRVCLAPLIAAAIALFSAMAPPALAIDPEELRMLTSPVEVVIHLKTDNEPLVGELVWWTHHTFAVRPKITRSDPLTARQAREIDWATVGSKRSYELRRQIIDQGDPNEWLLLGILMLDMDDKVRAGRAFAVARRLNHAHSAPIETKALELRASGESALGAMIEEPEEEKEELRVKTTRVIEDTPPEPDEHPIGPDDEGAIRGWKQWPKLSSEEQATATEYLRELVDEKIQELEFKIRPIETKHFLFYSDLFPPETRKWGEKLDEMYATLLRVLDMPTNSRLFQGKCVVVILASHERFLRFEQEVFNFDASRAGGVCHQRGGNVFVVFWRKSDSTRFQSVLIHETVHAFMYRYRSPAKLPTWAEEGLADYVAGWLTKGSQEPRIHWEHCRKYVRSGKSALDIMAQSYADGTWFTKDSYPVSHMLVRFMLKYKPREFKQWIDDVKSGKPWEPSMNERFGITPEELATGFADETASEKYYKRLKK